MAFANDIGNIPAGIPSLLRFRVPQHRARQSYGLAQDVILLQHVIDVDGLQLDGGVLRVSPGPVELFGCLREGSMGKHCCTPLTSRERTGGSRVAKRIS